jgi:hypothetical protein
MFYYWCKFRFNHQQIKQQQLTCGDIAILVGPGLIFHCCCCCCCWAWLKFGDSCGFGGIIEPMFGFWAGWPGNVWYRGDIGPGIWFRWRVTFGAVPLFMSSDRFSIGNGGITLLPPIDRLSYNYKPIKVIDYDTVSLYKYILVRLCWKL